MFLKLRPIVLFVSGGRISGFAWNCTGINASILAQETQPSTKKECPLGKRGDSSCNTTSGCESKQACGKPLTTCAHDKNSTSSSECNTHCNKQSKCGKRSKEG